MGASRVLEARSKGLNLSKKSVDDVGMLFQAVELLGRVGAKIVKFSRMGCSGFVGSCEKFPTGIADPAIVGERPRSGPGEIVEILSRTVFCLTAQEWPEVLAINHSI